VQGFLKAERERKRAKEKRGLVYNARISLTLFKRSEIYPCGPFEHNGGGLSCNPCDPCNPCKPCKPRTSVPRAAAAAGFGGQQGAPKGRGLNLSYSHSHTLVFSSHSDSTEDATRPGDGWGPSGNNTIKQFRYVR